MPRTAQVRIWCRGKVAAAGLLRVLEYSRHLRGVSRAAAEALAAITAVRGVARLVLKSGVEVSKGAFGNDVMVSYLRT